MTRPMRSVVKLFEKLSFDQQKEALGLLHAAHERSRAAKMAELQRQLTELGYDAPKVSAQAKTPKSANGNGAEKKLPKRAAKKNGRATSVQAKYRDGKTGETWSGRGRMATWLKAKREAGENIEKYLLG